MCGTRYMAAIKGCEYRYGHNTAGFMVPDTFSNNSRLKHFCSLTFRRHIKFDIEGPPPPNVFAGWNLADGNNWLYYLFKMVTN